MKRKQVFTFVDWTSQVSNAGQRAEPRADRRARNTLKYVSEKISGILTNLDKTIDLFQVEMRLYHGWHRGLSPTENKLALTEIISNNELPKVVGRSRFDWNSPFGDTLLDALDHRKHRRLGIHLPGTLRVGLAGGTDREKMVDGALICDLLCSSRSDPGSLKLVMAEDDDIVPAIFVSEKWGKDHQGKTILARTRENEAFLSLSGLIRNF